VPVVYDSVGKDTLMASLDSLQPRGSLVSNGTTSGPVVVDSTLLAVKGSLWMTRPAMIHYATPRPHMLAMAQELFDLVPGRQDQERAAARRTRWPTRPRRIARWSRARRSAPRYSCRDRRPCAENPADEHGRCRIARLRARRLHHRPRPGVVRVLR
jgi:hypothetical protein